MAKRARVFMIGSEMIMRSSIKLRFLHTTKSLLMPRNFKKPGLRKSYAPIDESIDRQALKDHVQSLYTMDWESIYRKPDDGESSKISLLSSLDIKSCENTGVSFDTIKEFLELESGQTVTCFGDNANGMMVVQLESSRARYSIGNDLIRKFKKNFENHKVRREGLEAESDWIVIDLGNIMVHLMSPEARIEYNLEEKWSAESNDSNEINASLLSSVKPKSWLKDPHQAD